MFVSDNGQGYMMTRRSEDRAINIRTFKYPNNKSTNQSSLPALVLILLSGIRRSIHSFNLCFVFLRYYGTFYFQRVGQFTGFDGKRNFYQSKFLIRIRSFLVHLAPEILICQFLLKYNDFLRLV